MNGVAGGALSGAAAGTAVVPGIGTAIGAGLGALSGYLASRKTKGQKELEAANAAEAARIAAEQARLSGGAGGMSASKLLGAQSAVRGAAASAANEQIANAMRGSASGASGMQQNAIASAQEAEQRAVAQGMSSVREQDLAYAQAQRDQLAAQKQALFNNQLTTTGMQQANRQQLYGSLADAAKVGGGLADTRLSPATQLQLAGQHSTLDQFKAGNLYYDAATGTYRTK